MQELRSKHTDVSATVGKAEPTMENPVWHRSPTISQGLACWPWVRFLLLWFVLLLYSWTRGAVLCMPQSRNLKININNHILYLFFLANTFWIRDHWLLWSILVPTPLENWKKTWNCFSGKEEKQKRKKYSCMYSFKKTLLSKIH